jgi:hypothetical protein
MPSLRDVRVICLDLYCLTFSWLVGMSWDSSVGIATGYGLDDRIVGVQFPVEGGNFSLRNRVQTGSGAHPASYPKTTQHSKTRKHIHVRAGFKPAIPVFERSKTVRASDRAAIGTGILHPLTTDYCFTLVHAVYQ